MPADSENRFAEFEKAYGIPVRKIVHSVNCAALRDGKTMRETDAMVEVVWYAIPMALRVMGVQGFQKARAALVDELGAGRALKLLEAKGCTREVVELLVLAARWMKKQPMRKDWGPPKNFSTWMEAAAQAIEALFRDSPFSIQLAHLALQEAAQLAASDKPESLPTSHLFATWRSLPSHLRLLAATVGCSLGPTRNKRGRPVFSRIGIRRGVYYAVLITLQNYVAGETGGLT